MEIKVQVQLRDLIPSYASLMTLPRFSVSNRAAY